MVVTLSFSLAKGCLLWLCSVTFVATVSFHIARPPAPSYSCALSNGNSNMTRLTLTWTQSPSDDNITQYCINSHPEYPFANSVCVPPNVRMYHYDVQEGLEYNFTVFAVNCGNQNGTKTPPILVFPQGVCVCILNGMHHTIWWPCSVSDLPTVQTATRSS